MRARTFPLLASCLLTIAPIPILSSALSCGGARTAQAVVLITLDTTRADRLGCYGNRSIDTPALDRVAREGVMFRQASAVAPVTLPSHSSMMTGRYPAAHGVRNNGMFVLGDAERTLAEVFKSHGYETGAFVGAFPLASAFGLRQGFDTYDEKFRKPGQARGLLYADYDERSADQVNAAALPWIDRQKGKNFFLWVHYFDPHAPYDPPSPFRERYASKPYDGEIAFVDSSVSELLAHVAQAAEQARTVVAIVGDHGESLGEHGEFFHGLFVYEATIRCPFLLRAPGRLPAGAVVDEPVSLVDVFPTLLDLAGLRGEIDTGPMVQGVDLAPSVSTAKSPGPSDEPIVIETLLPRLEFGWSELVALRAGTWKFVDAPQPELYDLAADPQEKRNVLRVGFARDADAGSARARAEEMRQRLRSTLGRASSSALEGSSRRPADEETVARLRSLGYMQAPGDGMPRQVGETNHAALKDPKDMIGVYEKINAVGVVLRKGDFDAAAAACRDILSRDPDNPRIQWWYGEALLSAGKTSDLNTFLGSVPSGDPSHFWVADLQGRLKESQGDTAGAIAAYRGALKRDMAAADTALRLASLLRREGRLPESLQVARGVLDRKPDHLAAVEFASDTQRMIGNFSAAIDVWKKAAAAAPDDRRFLIPLGRLLFETGRYEESRPIWRTLARLDPESAEPLRQLGALDVMKGDDAAALVSLRRASEIQPDDPLTGYWLGVALIQSGDLAGAEAQITPLIEHRPGSPLGHRALGLLREKQGRREEALSSFRTALSLQPDDPISRRELERLGGKR